MQKSVIAVLLDTVSIQRYIFSTNNLKENIGASQAVEDIYDTHLKKVIEKIFPSLDESYYDAWYKYPEKTAISELSVPFEIGYIGGGNALLFFKEEEKAEEFIRHWSLRLLIHCPGLIPATAIGTIDLKNFSVDLKDLFKKLAQNKSSFTAETVIRRHGITAECPNTGYSAEVWCSKLPEEKQNYISSVSNAKILSVDRGKVKLEALLREIGLNDNYSFTDEIDKLGQSKGEESHIAIVHIDGNDMGKRFQSQTDIVNLRKLSISVRDATHRTFKSLLEKIHLNRENIEKAGLNLRKEGGKILFPLRPIIIGGDDITFVSEGRLGLWLAKTFLEEFENQKVSDGKPLSACAGVAITKTKYPFYRGYRLSEELTRNAKDKRKLSTDNGSWIDFHISYGGFSGPLNEIRNSHYKIPPGISLLLRPYSVSDFSELLKGVWELKTKFPRSKIMKLREVLHSSKAVHKLFLKEIKIRGLKIPSYKDFSAESIILNSKTPYLDMIEIGEFYPDFALKGGVP